MAGIGRTLTRVFLVSTLAGHGSAALAGSRCSFTAPAGWSQADTRWDGACSQGRAEGLGVLKEYGDQKVERFFFGHLSQGEIEQGVIDEAEGYIAGRFRHGVLLPSEDRQSYLDAFGTAEQAATQAAERYKKVGNHASARFYERKAKTLREQMD